MTDTALRPETTELHERSTQLEALAAMLAAVTETGRGRVALVYGEAGIGKSALVRRFTEDAPRSARVLWGACDALFTPRPLGPLVDIARTTGGRLAEVLGGDATPFDVATVLAETLAGGGPAVVIVEDVHLADEATLDVLRTLGARASTVPALILLTYRDDAMDRWHPLRMVLAEVCAAANVERLRLASLSPETVAAMAAAYEPNAEELYGKTAGNPFYVTEALAARDAQVPETVRDAVLARAARLSEAARRLLEAIAILRPQADLWLLEALAGDDIAALEEATTSGMVAAGNRAVTFRHELARLTVEDAIPLHRRQALHRRALELLAEPPGTQPELARLAHHAEALADAASVLQFAPLAAAEAAKVGAHRQADAHYRAALRFAEFVPAEMRPLLYFGAAYESYMISRFAEAAEAQQEAQRSYEEIGDRAGQAAALLFLAQMVWQAGSVAQGRIEIERALELLGDVPSPQLVAAYYYKAMFELVAEDPPSARRWAKKAREAAAKIDNARARGAALQITGWSEFYTGDRGGLEKLSASVDALKADGSDDLAGFGYVIIVRTACRKRDYETVDRFLEEGIGFCTVRDIDVWRFYLLSWKSRLLLARGDWAEAEQLARVCLTKPCPFSQAHALGALGQVLARRGDPAAWEPLDDLLALATPRREAQWVAAAAAARAEAAFLEGRTDDVLAETDRARDIAAGTWYEGALAYWRWRAGADVAIPDDGEEHYRLEMAGDWTTARERWLAIGCRYEAAFALLDADDDGLRLALSEFRTMGATAAARIAERRLRERGVRGVPRGPHQRTRDNPAGLTARELEVLALLAEGLRNAQIAERLVVSERTVDHHVSAVLRKLDVRTRGEAGAAAFRLGLAAPK